MNRIWLFFILLPCVLNAKEISLEKYDKTKGFSTSSYCASQDQNGQVVGIQANEKMYIASLTKLFTSYFALRKLGPDYRFPTQFFYDPATQHMHIKGSLDPFIGREVLQFFVSEWNRLGIQHIKKLTFDENFSVYLEVDSKDARFLWADQATPEVRYGQRGAGETLLDLKAFFQNPSKYFSASKLAAQAVGVRITPPKIHVDTVEMLPNNNFIRTTNSLYYYYHSSPLLSYLKELNIWSINYVADQLLARLGGIKPMRDFLKKDLDLTEDLEFYTGSGLSIEWDNERKDNLASCETVLKLLARLDAYLKSNQLNLSDLLLLAGQDNGTLSTTAQFNNALVAKTGTLNTAITLAGKMSTNTGEHYFGIFFEFDSYRQQQKAHAYRDEVLKQLLLNWGGSKPIAELPAAPQKFMPFDLDSSLRESYPLELRYD